MTGTDYNAIVAELNKPTTTIRPKAQPDDSHIMGRNQGRMKILTGNGEGAEHMPARRYCDIAPNETERRTNKHRVRNDLLAKRTEERRKSEEAKNTEAMKRTLNEIFSA